MLVIVRHITDPAAAAAALDERGEHADAQTVRGLGVGRHVIPGPQFQYRSDAAKARQQLRPTAVPGLSYKIAVDYDPDWTKQRTAAQHAVAALPDGAVAVVNAYLLSYYGWGTQHAIVNHGRNWRDQAAAINYRHGAHLVVHAMAARLGESAPLITAARAGFAADQITATTPEEQVVHCVVATLNDTGHSDLATVMELIECGANGDF